MNVTSILRSRLTSAVFTAVVVAILFNGTADSAGSCAIYRSWSTGQQLTASDLTTSFTTVGVTNDTPTCMDDYSSNAAQMNLTTDPYPSGAASLATNMAGELERIRYVIKDLTGWSQWYAHSERPALPTFNYVFNGDVEIWGSGTSSAATGWTLNGAGATVAKDTTNFKVGTAAMALTRAGTDCTLQLTVTTAYPPATFWRSRTVTFGAWVRATVASRARIRIDDGVSTSFSSYHSGGSAFEFLTVTRTLDAAATTVQVAFQVDTGNTTAQFDGAILVTGNNVSDFIPSGWTGRKTVLNFDSAGATVAAGSTVYLANAANATETLVTFMVPYKGVARRLHALAGAAAGAAQTYTYTFRTLETTDSSLTSTTTGAGVRHSIDSTNEVEINNATAAVSVKLVTSAGAPVTTHSATVVYEEIPQ